MLLAIGIAIIQGATFLSYLIESSFFMHYPSEETHALMVGVAMFTAMMSIPTAIWNYIMVKDNQTKRDIASFIVSIMSFVFAIGFLITSFLIRIYARGMRFI